MKTLYVILGTLLLTGCNNFYTTSVCPPSQRIDIPGFEGTREVRQQDSRTFQIKSTPATITRVSQGTYQGPQGEVLFACSAQGKIVVETQDESGKFSAYFLTRDTSGFNLSYAAFDTDELTRAGVKFEITDQQNGNVKIKSLIVQNSPSTDPSLILGLMKPISLTIKLY